MTAILTVPNSRTPVDLLLFRRLQAEVPGLVEGTLAMDGNRGLAGLGPFPPRGTKIMVTPPVPISRQAPRASIRLYD